MVKVVKSVGFYQILDHVPTYKEIFTVLRGKNIGFSVRKSYLFSMLKDMDGKILVSTGHKMIKF